MLSTFKKLFHIHKYVLSHKLGINNYYECYCGARMFNPSIDYGYSPVDWEWLNSATDNIDSDLYKRVLYD